MKRAIPILTIALGAALWIGASARAAEFGLKDLAVSSTAKGGAPEVQAGAHPFALNFHLAAETEEVSGDQVPVAEAKDVKITAPPGLAGNPTAVPRCTAVQFLSGGVGECPDAAALGIAEIEFGTVGESRSATVPIFNLIPSPGHAAKIGFIVENVAPVVVDLDLNPNPPHNVISSSTNISQGVFFLAADVTLWGVPAADAHDSERGSCLSSQLSCGISIPEVPFITLPTSCAAPLSFGFEADSWQNPTAPPYPFQGSAIVHDNAVPPNDLGASGCAKLEFNPTIAAQPTTKAAFSPTGLDFSLDVADEGINNPAEGATAASTIKKAVVTLPEGMSANPSLAEGLNVCTEGQLEAETPFSNPGAGCPNASKIGTVEVETPLLEGELLKGALYIAKPYENQFGSLLALYIVIKNPKLGILVTQAAKVEPDPLTGRLVTTTDEIPQLPFSHFRLHFREGGRSPLISPPSCGAHTVTAELFPWSGGKPLTTTSAFGIVSGPNEGPCPPAGLAPFHPGFEAGSVNNSAGAYSPFDMRLTHHDGEQDMTKFSAVLPPGVVGKIAGVAKCPEAQIAQAKSRTGPHGGQEELDHPSCPASSRIGRTLAGAGVGSQLTYVPGSLYLAGPIGGDPLSVVSITPALAGPFDAGAVVVRVALTLNPQTAEVEADGSHSDPIPHILKGIPLNVRDLRVYADKPNFTINPTNCEPSSARATLFGSFLNPLDPADDLPVGLSARYQAANCAALDFKPNLAIKLIGGTKRGGHPALTATVLPRPGDANFRSAVVTLPHSAFLDQAHIRTICTRVQFASGQGNGANCPPDSIYGHAKASSPLIEETLEGPVFLRSSSHNLPDLVIALHGIVDINLASRIDSQKGGIRSTFDAIPDAPVSKFVLEMQGAKKGLIVNSTNLCNSTNRVEAKLTGQNGRLDQIKPAVGAKCPKGKRHQRRHHSKRAALRHLRAAR